MITPTILSQACAEIAEALTAAFPSNVWSVFPEVPDTATPGWSYGFVIRTQRTPEQARLVAPPPEPPSRAMNVISRPRAQWGDPVPTFTSRILPDLLSVFELALEHTNYRFPRPNGAASWSID